MNRWIHAIETVQSLPDENQRTLPKIPTLLHLTATRPPPPRNCKLPPPPPPAVSIRTNSAASSQKRAPSLASPPVPGPPVQRPVSIAGSLHVLTSPSVLLPAVKEYASTSSSSLGSPPLLPPPPRPFTSHYSSSTESLNVPSAASYLNTATCQQTPPRSPTSLSSASSVAPKVPLRSFKDVRSPTGSLPSPEIRVTKSASSPVVTQAALQAQIQQLQLEREAFEKEKVNFIQMQTDWFKEKLQWETMRLSAESQMPNRNRF